MKMVDCMAIEIKYGLNLNMIQSWVIRCLCFLETNMISLDGFIQKKNRHQFLGCKSIIISHRVSSIIDSDFIQLLKDGEIAEYGAPSKLLSKKSYAFAKLD